MGKFVEVEICEQLKQIIQRETNNLFKKTEKWMNHDYAALEKLTKSYAVLMDDMRKNMDAGVWDKLNKQK